MDCCCRPHKVAPTLQDTYSLPKTQSQLSELFMGEVLSCGVCKRAFSLRQNEVVAYCGGCYQFLHCGIAGQCVGPNCVFQIRGKTYKQTWCVRCIPLHYKINTQKIGSRECSCLCQECADDPNTPKQYKQI